MVVLCTLPLDWVGEQPCLARMLKIAKAARAVVFSLFSVSTEIHLDTFELVALVIRIPEDSWPPDRCTVGWACLEQNKH